MGLAPWAGKHRNDLKDWYFPPSSDPKSTGAGVGLGDNFYHKHNFMAGNPFDGTFKVPTPYLSAPSPAYPLACLPACLPAICLYVS